MRRLFQFDFPSDFHIRIRATDMYHALSLLEVKISNWGGQVQHKGVTYPVSLHGATVTEHDGRWLGPITESVPVSTLR